LYLSTEHVFENFLEGNCPVVGCLVSGVIVSINNMKMLNKMSKLRPMEKFLRTPMSLYPPPRASEFRPINRCPGHFKRCPRCHEAGNS